MESEYLFTSSQNTPHTGHYPEPDESINFHTLLPPLENDLSQCNLSTTCPTGTSDWTQNFAVWITTSTSIL